MHRETPRTRQALFLFVIATFAALPMLTLPSVEAATLFYYEANIAPTAAGWTLSQSFWNVNDPLAVGLPRAPIFGVPSGSAGAPAPK